MSRYKCSTYGQDSSHCFHTLHNLSVSYQTSQGEVNIPLEVCGRCQRLEVPCKTLVCHLKFTLWVKFFKEKYFRQKHLQACIYHTFIIHTFLFLGLSLFYLSAQNIPPYPHSNSFPDQRLFNFNLGSPARKKLSWISRAVPLEVELPRHLGTTIPADLPQDSILRVSPHPNRGRQGCSLSCLLLACHWQRANFVQTDLKLRGTMRSPGGYW